MMYWSYSHVTPSAIYYPSMRFYSYIMLMVETNILLSRSEEEGRQATT